MTDNTERDARASLESIGWSASTVRRYPEKAFDLMVEFYALSEREPVVVDDAIRLRAAIEEARERHRVWGTPEDPDGFKPTSTTLGKMHRQVMDILDAALTPDGQEKTDE